MTPDCTTPRPRALVVEDSPITQSLLAEQLEAAGFDVTRVTTAADCEPPFALGVLGLELPDGRGEDVAQTLLARGIVGEVVFVTQACDADRLAHAAALGPVLQGEAAGLDALQGLAQGVYDRLHRAEPSRASLTQPRPRRVLVLDDEILTLRATARVLRSRGHEVQTALAPLEALAHARRQPVQVAVLDIELGPGPNGIDVARRLLSRGLTERVVFYTGTADTSLYLQAVHHGRVIPKASDRATEWLVGDVEIDMRPEAAGH
ncbi:MAG: response regulator [Polyangiaceae bacterium]